jgi:cytochrome c-type biogenesis protein CcmH/NrfF
VSKARRLLAIAALAVLAIVPALTTPSGAQQLSDRAKQIGGKFMCMCGCSRVLTQCNHVGCTTSAGMLKELNQSLDRGGSEDAITQMFVQEFGTKVYAEPPKSGFSLVAWAMPSVYLVFGTGLVVFVISRWRKPPVPAKAADGNTPQISPELLERARERAARETED